VFSPGREGLHPTLELGRPDGGLHVRVGRRFAGQRDVLAQSRVEDERVLKDQADLSTGGSEGHVASPRRLLNLS
jgi:hypothetical protein